MTHNFLEITSFFCFLWSDQGQYLQIPTCSKAKHQNTLQFSYELKHSPVYADKRVALGFENSFHSKFLTYLGGG